MSTVQFTSSAYVQLRTLNNGHSDTVNSLCFSSDGVHLASGGDDQSVIIWNALKGQLLYRILFDNAVDCVLWHPKYAETLIVGLASGFLLQMHGFSLHNYHKQDIHLGARSTIYSLDYDSQTACLAIGMGEEVHLTREVERNTYQGDVVLPPPGASQEHRNEGADTRVRAIAVKFHKNGTHLIVSYVGHGIICWNVSVPEPEQVWRIVTPTGFPNIGGTDVSPDARRIAVYNLVDGLHLYAVGGSAKQKPRKHYKFDKPPQSKHLLQVRFIHDGRALLCGTTTGNVLLWEVDSGEVLQELSHGDAIIQAISAVKHKSNSYIATGTAAKGQTTYIKIWRARVSASIDSGDREFQDAVADLVEAVAGNRLPVARERLKDLISLLLGLTTCAVLVWLGTMVSWPEVWDYTLLLMSDIATTTERIVYACSVYGSIALDNTRLTVSTVAARLADIIRDATLAFLFPDRREVPLHVEREL